MSYGKIYDTTWWGVGRDNAIGWGIVYASLGNPAPAQTSRFVQDTEADGGVVECPSCGQTDLEFLNDNP
jgi:hypothetical protein